MENKSAVEWLEKELKERYPLFNSEPLFEQAKKMESDQENQKISILLDGLRECEIQLEYLNDKFGYTGTTNSILVRLKNIITQYSNKEK